MEAVTIPAWFLWIISAFMTMTIPWAIWITRQTFQNDKDIAINTTNDAKVNSELAKLNTSIDDKFKKMDLRFEKLDDKITQFLIQGNQFLSQEVSFLKQFVKP